MGGQERFDLCQLSLPAHERGQTHRQVRRDLERLERGELAGQTIDDDLVDRLGLVEVLQAVMPEIADAHPAGESLRSQPAGGLGDQDLPPVAGRGDPGRPMDVEPDILVASQSSLARVHPHPDPNGPVARPRVFAQLPLGGCGRGHRIRGRDEDGEERVAFRSDVDASVIADGFPEDVVVLLQNLRPSLAEGPGQVRRALDVGEQERDGPRRESGHVFSPNA